VWIADETVIKINR
jgi:IS1 family transposase